MLKPALLFNVRLLILPVNVEAGIDCAAEPLNTTVVDALLASILPDVRLMLPLRIKLTEPVVNVPEVSVSAPAIVNA